jgi:hypothetical protein
VAEAENNMGELAGGEAVDGGASSGVVADDGEGVWGDRAGPGRRGLSFCGGCGQGGCEKQEEQARVHNHPFVLEKYLKWVVCNGEMGTNFDAMGSSIGEDIELIADAAGHMLFTIFEFVYANNREGPERGG